MNTSHFWTVLLWITRVSFNLGLFKAATADVSLRAEGPDVSLRTEEGRRGCHPPAFILLDWSVPCCSGDTRHAALLVIWGPDTKAGAALHCGDAHYLSFCVTSHMHTQFCHSTILRIGVRRKLFQTIMANYANRPHCTGHIVPSFQHEKGKTSATLTP